jgi:hypothetical protein
MTLSLRQSNGSRFPMFPNGVKAPTADGSILLSRRLITAARLVSYAFGRGSGLHAYQPQNR